MTLRHIGSVALLVLMAVAALFFCPVSHGSFSATHGPMTALRASRLRAVLLFVIASAAAALAMIVAALVQVGNRAIEVLSIASDSSSLSFAPLRC